MIVWLDHKIFGNGYGLGSPYWDSRFYWLSGEFYTWAGWFGCQLQSFQWRHPRAGERRRLAGRTFEVYRSERMYWWLGRRYIFGVPLPIGRVRVTWALAGDDALSKDIDTANAQLRKLSADLGDWFPR
jgi:hypothetical protein